MCYLGSCETTIRTPKEIFDAGTQAKSKILF